MGAVEVEAAVATLALRFLLNPLQFTCNSCGKYVFLLLFLLMSGSKPLAHMIERIKKCVGQWPCFGHLKSHGGIH